MLDQGCFTFDVSAGMPLLVGPGLLVQYPGIQLSRPL